MHLADVRKVATAGCGLFITSDVIYHFALNDSVKLYEYCWINPENSLIGIYCL